MFQNLEGLSLTARVDSFQELIKETLCDINWNIDKRFFTNPSSLLLEGSYFQKV